MSVGRIGRRLALGLCLAIAASAGGGWVSVWREASAVTTAAVMTGTMIVTAILAWVLLHRSLRSATIAVEDAAARLDDHDASSRIAWRRNDEVGGLLDAANRLTDAWSAERGRLRERELVLEAVLEASPVGALLVDRRGHITYASQAARQMFAPFGRLVGRSLEDLAGSVPAPLGSSLTSPTAEGFLRLETAAEDVVHLRRRRLVLRGAASTLILLERITTEVRRGELATWKRTTRLLCHELNNSLAPIASLSRSAGRLIGAGQLAQAADALSVVEERSAHLARFIADYGALARLPPPRPEHIEWSVFLAEIVAVTGMTLVGDPPLQQASFDPALLEQVLINLAKNAREASAAGETVELQVQGVGPQGFLISVRDRGAGFSPEALQEGLLPFWTSKSTGTGLGLALAREVLEAHRGRVTLRNRDGGGAEVVLFLPATAQRPRT